MKYRPPPDGLIPAVVRRPWPPASDLGGGEPRRKKAAPALDDDSKRAHPPATASASALGTTNHGRDALHMGMA